MKMKKCRTLGVVCVLLGILLIYMVTQSFFQSYNEARAFTQIAILYEMQEEAHSLNTPIGLAKGLRDVVLLSPRATNVAGQNRLIHCVEMVRSNVVNELVLRLKAATGQDFGSNTVTSIDAFILNNKPTRIPQDF